MAYHRAEIYCLFGKIGSICIKGLLSISLCLLFFSCTSIRNIEIEMAVLPEFPISDDVQSLVLINRSMNMQFLNTPEDSLEKILIKNEMHLDSVFRDSVACDTVIHVAARELFNSGRFDVVIPKNEIINRNDSDDIRNPLDINTIDGLCQQYNVDAVLVLESFVERLVTKYDYQLFSYNSSESFGARTDVKYKSEWRLYRPDNMKPALRFQLSDSIFWDGNSSTLRDVYAQMPHIKESLIGGGVAAGSYLASHISPNWVSRTRNYFSTGIKEIDLAIPLICNNKWEEATSIWSKYANIDSKRIRAKVEFNLALASEMNGNLDVAINWGLKSIKSHYTYATENYLDVLEAARKAKMRESKKRY